jgi:hypothetical protein
MSPVQSRVAARPSAAALVRVTGRVAKREKVVCCLTLPTNMPCPNLFRLQINKLVNKLPLKEDIAEGEEQKSPVRSLVASPLPLLLFALPGA